MTTYGIAYGTSSTTTIEECDSLDAAVAAAVRICASGDDCALVELDGRGPVHDSDGEVIAETHAPRRTRYTLPALTDAIIEAMRTEAGSAGDMEMVAICDAALSGDTQIAARIACAHILADSKAQE